jgi:phosphoribosylformylglycinamidine cyclo-ligase
VDYKQAGVDIEEGYRAVGKYRELAASTANNAVLNGIGSFAGMYSLKANGSAAMEEPVLVSGTDGVGTKLDIAFKMKKYDTVGIDCVAMCVNDILCQGAKPLFFLDYIGIGKLDPAVAADLVKGVSEGCVQAGCALVGGETAELPGIYQPGEYDLAGFAVGIVEKTGMINGAGLTPGDALIGVASSGLHSNGFSLVRKIFYEQEKLRIDSHIPELSMALGDALLTPTKIYAKVMGRLTQSFTVKAAAHITGGGWVENIPRLAGDRNDVKFTVHTDKAPVLPIFEYLRRKGKLLDSEMYNTFNMGVGMVLAVDKTQTEAVVEAIKEAGEAAYTIGTVEGRKAGEGPIAFA